MDDFERTFSSVGQSGVYRIRLLGSGFAGGLCPVGHRGGGGSVCLSLCTSIPSPSSNLRALYPRGPILIQILPIRPKSKQNGPNLARKLEFWPEVHHFGHLDLYWCLQYLDSEEDGAGGTNIRMDGRTYGQTCRFPL